MNNKSIDQIRKETWYVNLSEEGKYIFDLIHKYHQYFSDQDKKYKYIARAIKLLILFFTMVNTIVLGLKSVIAPEYQIVSGLVISALVTFVTAISSCWNFEGYWMRNVTIHIDLNIMRDNFVFEAMSGKLEDPEELERYRKLLEDIQKSNIEYWHQALKKVR